MGGVDLGAYRLVAGGKTQEFDSLVGELAFQAQRALDSDLPVAEVLSVEPFRLGGFLRLAEVDVDDSLDVSIREFTILLAEIAAQRLEPATCIDQLHFVTTRFGFLVGQHPDIGGDAGVVENVERQGDDGLQPVVLQHPTADVTLALACIAGEQRGAIMNQRDAAAQRRVVFHLLQLIHQEHELSVAGAGDKLELSIARVADDEALVIEFLLAAHALQIGLPTLAVGRVGDHEIKFARTELVSGQSGLISATDDVLGLLAFALQEQIGLADGVGFVANFLPEQVDGDFLAMLPGKLV